MVKCDGLALRELFYSLKGENIRRKLTIRINGPYLLDKNKVSFPIKEGFAGCTIRFDGLDEDDIEVFGADRLQALALSVAIDPTLRRFAQKYDFFYCDSGEPYFD